MTPAEARRARDQRWQQAREQDEERHILTTGETENVELREALLETLTWVQYRRTTKYFGLGGSDPMSIELIAADEGVSTSVVWRTLNRSRQLLSDNPSIRLRWIEFQNTPPQNATYTSEDTQLDDILAHLPAQGQLRPSGTSWASDTDLEAFTDYEGQKLYHRTNGWLAYGEGIPIEEAPVKNATETFWWEYGWREAEAESGHFFVQRLTDSRNLRAPHGNHGPKKAKLGSVRKDTLFNPSYARTLKRETRTPQAVWFDSINLPPQDRKALTDAT